MGIICRGCGYQRKPTDQAPDWECPACGKAYAKTSLDSHELSSGYAPSFKSPIETGLDEKPAHHVRHAGPISWITIFGCMLIAILAAFIKGSSQYLWPLTAVELVMPWIVVAATYALRDSLLRELGEYSSGVFCISLFLLVICVGLLAVNNSLVFEEGSAWHKGIVLAIPFALVCAAVVRRLDSEVLQQPRLPVWSLLILVAYVYGGALTALGNRWLDHGSSTVYEATVIGKYVRSGGRGGSISYIAKLAPWGPIVNGDEIGIHSSEYDAMEPGRSNVCMAAHRGTFGMAWGQRVPCAGQTSVEK